jgi:hypothetical protein
MNDFIHEPHPIEVTQYVLPNGRKKRSTTRVDEARFRHYLNMKDHNCRLEVEILTTREVSLSIHNTFTGEDIDIEITENGHGVKDALYRLLNRQSWINKGGE